MFRVINMAHYIPRLQRGAYGKEVEARQVIHLTLDSKEGMREAFEARKVLN